MRRFALLVSAIADPYIVRRHALAEALRVREYLLRENDGAYLGQGARALELGFTPEGDEFAAHFTEFLKYAVHLKDAE